MRRTRQIIAVTLLTTALCADSQVLATSVSESVPASPPLARTACQIASRFTRSLQRDVSRVALVRDERPIAASATPSAAARSAALVFVRPHPAQLRAEEFRLPPPLA